MTYKAVMVGLALGQPNDTRLEVAAQLAKWFGARVIGVAAAEFSPPASSDPLLLAVTELDLNQRGRLTACLNNTKLG
jgi:hypothetical protein